MKYHKIKPLLPDDRNTIRPFARRTNGNIICVKRAAPIEKYISVINQKLYTLKLSYQVSLCQSIFVEPGKEPIQVHPMPPMLRNEQLPIIHVFPLVDFRILAVKLRASVKVFIYERKL